MGRVFLVGPERHALASAGVALVMFDFIADQFDFVEDGGLLGEFVIPDFGLYLCRALHGRRFENATAHKVAIVDQLRH